MPPGRGDKRLVPVITLPIQAPVSRPIVGRGSTWRGLTKPPSAPPPPTIQVNHLFVRGICAYCVPYGGMCFGKQTTWLSWLCYDNLVIMAMLRQPGDHGNAATTWWSWQCYDNLVIMAMLRQPGDHGYAAMTTWRSWLRCDKNLVIMAMPQGQPGDRGYAATRTWWSWLCRKDNLVIMAMSRQQWPTLISAVPRKHEIIHANNDKESHRGDHSQINPQWLPSFKANLSPLRYDFTSKN